MTKVIQLVSGSSIVGLAMDLGETDRKLGKTRLYDVVIEKRLIADGSGAGSIDLVVNSKVTRSKCWIGAYGLAYVVEGNAKLVRVGHLDLYFAKV